MCRNKTKQKVIEIRYSRSGSNTAKEEVREMENCSKEITQNSSYKNKQENANEGLRAIGYRMGELLRLEIMNIKCISLLINQIKVRQ